MPLLTRGKVLFYSLLSIESELKEFLHHVPKGVIEVSYLVVTLVRASPIHPLQLCIYLFDHIRELLEIIFIEHVLPIQVPDGIRKYASSNEEEGREANPDPHNRFTK